MISPTPTSKASSMPKALTIFAMVVTALLFLIFGLDAILGIPFDQASIAMDIGIVLCSAILGYVCWQTYRELK